MSGLFNNEPSCVVFQGTNKIFIVDKFLLKINLSIFYENNNS